jgi:hypothetical protein
MVYLAGRRQPYTDLRTLELSRYSPFLDRQGVRTPPSTGLDYSGQIVNDSGKYPLTVSDPLGNYEFLTCVPAAMLRLSQVWRAVRGQDREPTSEQALALYGAVSPFQVPESTTAQIPDHVHEATYRAEYYRDYGATMLESFKVWRNLRDADKFTPTAAMDESGATRNLEPARTFLEIEPGNVQQLRDAIYLCHGALIGLNLPRSILVGEEPADDWYVPSYGPIADATPGNWGSHCVLAVGYSDRVIHCVAWDRRFTISYPFLRAYTQEAWCVVPEEPIGALESLLKMPELHEKIEEDLARVAAPGTGTFSMPAFGRFWGGPNIMGGGT